MKQYKPIKITLKLNASIYFETNEKALGFDRIYPNILLKIHWVFKYIFNRFLPCTNYWFHSEKNRQSYLHWYDPN